MRLSSTSIDIIKSTLSRHLKDTQLFLFGSRVDDAKRGGDIDLFVRTSQNVSLKEELFILAKLELNGIMRKVDLVLETPEKNKDTFFMSIKDEAIAL